MRILIGKAGVDDESALHVFFLCLGRQPFTFFLWPSCIFFFHKKCGECGEYGEITGYPEVVGLILALLKIHRYVVGL